MTPRQQAQPYAVELLNQGATIRATQAACFERFGYKPSNSLVTKWRDQAGISVKQPVGDRTEAAQVAKFNRLMGHFNAKRNNRRTA